MPITNTIERKFRNVDLEYNVVAHCLVHTEDALLFKTAWITVEPLADILRCVHKYRIQFTKPILLHKLRETRKLQKDNVEIYNACLDRLAKQKPIGKKAIVVAAQQLADLYASRNVLYGMQGIVNSIKDFNLVDARAKLRQLSQDTEIVDSHTAGDWVSDFEQRVEIVKTRAEVDEDGSKSTGIPTGIKKLDRLIGGVMPGEFGVIAGKPSIGKTAMLVGLGIHAYTLGHNVLFASGEMTKADIEFRIDANLAGISASAFRTGELTKSDWSRWKKAVDRYKLTASNYFEICAFPRNFSALDVETRIQQAQDKHSAPISLVCLDYLNIMNAAGSRGSNKDWEAQSDVIWDIKGMIAELNGGIAGWTAGQIKDEAFDVDVLGLQHIKYARAISETAPIVLGLVQNEDDELEGRIQLQVLKMRNAKRFPKPIFLHPNMDLMRMHEAFMENKSLLSLEDEVGEQKKEQPPVRKQGHSAARRDKR